MQFCIAITRGVWAIVMKKSELRLRLVFIVGGGYYVYVNPTGDVGACVLKIISTIKVLNSGS